jgi:hypothetical protein
LKASALPFAWATRAAFPKDSGFFLGRFRRCVVDVQALGDTRGPSFVVEGLNL